MEISKDIFAKANVEEYGEKYQEFAFIPESGAVQGELERQELLDEIVNAGGFSCAKGAKIHSGALSPGCQCCMEGSWSCLFINNICNGSCFYCPTPQKSKSEPTTNNLNFPRPQDYLDYLGTFGFQGASISGGEPFMTYDRTLSYVTKVKKRFGSMVYLWLYTNSILATEDKIAALVAAGLDEIRVDITAVDYSLAKAVMAARILPTVTVEIPALPEDFEKLRDLLPRMEDAGIMYFNLHQLRCTPHNMLKLTARGYRFVHGPKVLVHDSELTALRILRHSLISRRGPAINYCSFAYKSRFQPLAARRRAAERLKYPHEDITEAGYIRSLSLRGPAQVLDRVVAKLELSNDAGLHWRREGADRLMLNVLALYAVAMEEAILQICYSDARLCSRPSLKGSIREIRLNRGRSIVAERFFAVSFSADAPTQSMLFLLLLDNQKGQKWEQCGPFAGCRGYEHLSNGLFPYC